jgi:hypothetical protein
LLDKVISGKNFVVGTRSKSPNQPLFMPPWRSIFKSAPQTYRRPKVIFRITGETFSQNRISRLLLPPFYRFSDVFLYRYTRVLAVFQPFYGRAFEHLQRKREYFSPVQHPGRPKIPSPQDGPVPPHKNTSPTPQKPQSSPSAGPPPATPASTKVRRPGKAVGLICLAE